MATASPPQSANPADDDSKRLAELGYKQELHRGWSGFSNFAISFSIISILSGCFTTFGQAWMNGGPIAISWGWPIISAFILIIGLCMSELVSAFPTAGGIYWWASRLGGPAYGWFTGWFNLIGLVAVTASVDYGCATFLNLIFANTINGWSGSLHQAFGLFIAILALHALINIFGARVIDSLQNISVWWHVAGVAAVVLILVFVPATHQSASFVFTRTINANGFFHQHTGTAGFWLYVLPLGGLLTQYTITGFDACAHVSEETVGAARTAASGLWRSIFYSAVGGWILLLAFLFAVKDPNNLTASFGFSGTLLQDALSSGFFKAVLVISTIGQFLCGMSCVTSMSRMMFAFSRDGAVPGWRVWTRLDGNGTPVNAVIAGCVAGGLLTLPALYQNNGAPIAFYAVVSVAVIGLYLAFLIPIMLRLRMGDRFTPGPWTLGRHYKWMGWAASIEIIVVAVYFILPTVPAGVPFTKGFSWPSVNYAPIAVGVMVLGVGLWWLLSARKWFTGPRRTIDEAPTPQPTPAQVE
ncbi:amino acid permease [Rugosimonospora acidiphila]|uniref:Amino acid permease n=1 Tax=Rugosimonospora acidiphila TaxID=556531 RepID=A0ABP9RMZ7_9ACTN